MATVYKQNSVTNLNAFQWLAGMTVANIPSWAVRNCTNMSDGNLAVQGTGGGTSACKPGEWVIQYPNNTFGTIPAVLFTILYQVGP